MFQSVSSHPSVSHCRTTGRRVYRKTFDKTAAAEQILHTSKENILIILLLKRNKAKKRRIERNLDFNLTTRQHSECTHMTRGVLEHFVLY